MIFPDSVNVQKFKLYLQELRERNPDDKICLFMDNLQVHKSEKSIKEMKRLGFKHIFNVSYSPEYNPIEFTFSKIKASFKALRAQKLTGLRQESHEQLIRKAVQTIRKQDVVNCVNHVKKLL